MSDTSGTFRRSLYIPEGVDDMEIMKQAAKALENLPGHTMRYVNPERRGGQEYKRLEITFEGGINPQSGALQLQQAFESAMHGNQLDQYLAPSLARSAR